MNALPVYNYRYIKTKIRTYGDKVYTIFHNLNFPDNGIDCEPSTIISIDSLLAYENELYLHVYLENYAYEIVEKQLTDNLDYNFVDEY